jgi:hypothetical protein
MLALLRISRLLHSSSTTDAPRVGGTATLRPSAAPLPYGNLRCSAAPPSPRDAQPYRLLVLAAGPSVHFADDRLFPLFPRRIARRAVPTPRRQRRLRLHHTCLRHHRHAIGNTLVAFDHLALDATPPSSSWLHRSVSVFIKVGGGSGVRRPCDFPSETLPVTSLPPRNLRAQRRPLHEAL